MGELIHAFLVSLSLINIVPLNLLKVVDKDQLSKSLFFIRKSKAKLNHPFLEGLLLRINGVRNVMSNWDGCEKQDSCDLPSFHD